MNIASLKNNQLQELLKDLGLKSSNSLDKNKQVLSNFLEDLKDEASIHKTVNAISDQSVKYLSEVFSLGQVERSQLVEFLVKGLTVEPGKKVIDDPIMTPPVEPGKKVIDDPIMTPPVEPGKDVLKSRRESLMNRLGGSRVEDRFVTFRTKSGEDQFFGSHFIPREFKAARGSNLYHLAMSVQPKLEVVDASH